MTDKLSNVPSVLSALSQVIDEKCKEKELLLDIISKLRKETARVKEDIQKIHKEQQLHYSNSTKTLTKFEKNVGQSKDIVKGLEICRRSAVALGDVVEGLNQRNEDVKKGIEKEKELAIDLNDMIKRMKTEIASQKRECDNIRKNLGVGEKQLDLIRQKHDKMSTDMARFYTAAQSNVAS